MFFFLRKKLKLLLKHFFLFVAFKREFSSKVSNHFIKLNNLGFRGKHCEENIDDCPGHLCQNGGTCIDGVNNYRCRCPPNFTGSYCELDVDECATR